MSAIGSVLNDTINGSAGAAQGREGTTITTFVISLAAGLVLFGVQFGTFLVIRNYLWAKRIYQPRSFLVPVRQRIKPPHSNPAKWLFTIFKIKDDPVVIEKAGMDAYFFLRFLSMCLKIFTPMAIIIMPILIPLNVTQGKGTNTIANVTYNISGLDTLAWSNVSPDHTDRYWAHLVLAVGVVFWVCFMFQRELAHYIVKRQEYLSSPGHRLKASATTVLIQDIPEDICNEEALEKMYGDFPGGIRRIWINRDLTSLVNKDKLRKYYENLLEDAETDLLRKVAKKNRKALSHNSGGSEPAAPQQRHPEAGPEGGAPQSALRELGPSTPEACRQDLEHDLATGAAWSKILTAKHRKKMRIPRPGHTTAAKVPIIGRFFTTKVDTIYYCRRELARLNKQIEIDAENHEEYPKNFSAFVQFTSQKAAHLACQSVAHTAPRHMKRRVVEISPGDINWRSLNLSWRSRYLRIVGFFILFLLLILAFGLISFFTGILSRVSTLADSTPWLEWIRGIPPWLLSFVQGTLPPVIQVIVLSGPLPILLRLLTNRTRGATTGQEGERSLQLWYFIFLLVELFIIPTVSSGLTSIVSDLIHSPATVPNILATNLPTAANYYFSFLILQALSLSATSILQTIRLFKFYVIGHVNTPDAVFEKLSWTNLTRIGSNVPWYTTFAVIGLVYSTIAPLMLLFMIITFSLFWVAIKNNLLYCVRTGEVDGGGLFFPSAINQMFTGLYFMEFCMIGLFFLVRDTEDNVACDTQGIIMAVVLVLTILYQMWLMNDLAPLFKYAPVQLEVESKALLAEYQAKNLQTPPSEAKERSTTPDVELRDPEKVSSSNPTDLEKVPSQNPTDLEKVPSRTPTDPGSSTEAPLEQQPSNAETSPAPARPPLWQRQSAKDLQAQQREDEQAAKRILARLNRPLDEARLAQMENKIVRRSLQLTRNINSVLLPRRKDIEAQMMDDPISKIVMQHHDELEELLPEERDMLISVAFTHPVLREKSPSVWIPRDDAGVSDDEVRRTRELSADVVIDNRGAYFDRKLKVQVDRPPPDMSEFALIIAEL